MIGTKGEMAQLAAPCLLTRSMISISRVASEDGTAHQGLLRPSLSRSGRPLEGGQQPFCSASAMCPRRLPVRAFDQQRDEEGAFSELSSLRPDAVRAAIKL
jgi:hypothetical protein